MDTTMMTARARPRRRWARRWLPGLDDLFAVAAGNLLVQFNCAAGPMFLPALVDRPRQADGADAESAGTCLGYARTCV